MLSTWEQTEFRMALCLQYGNPSFCEPWQKSSISSIVFCHLIISISLIWSVTETQTTEDYIYPCHSQSTWSSWTQISWASPHRKPQSCVLLPLFCIFRRQRSGNTPAHKRVWDTWEDASIRSSSSLLLSQCWEQQTMPSGTDMTNVHTDEEVERRKQDSGTPLVHLKSILPKHRQHLLLHPFYLHFHWDPQQIGSIDPDACVNQASGFFFKKRTKLQLPIITFPQSRHLKHFRIPF